MLITGIIILGIAFYLPAMASAQETGVQKYMMPPKTIADLIDAPPTPYISLSPDNRLMLIEDWPGLPSIEEVSQPELRLAGLRINPRTNGPSRTRYLNGLTIRKISDGSDTRVTGLPDKPIINTVQWSPDSKHVAFLLTIGDRMELWLTATDDGRAARLTDKRMNAAYGSAYTWLSDSKTIIAKTVPENRGEAPQEPTVPAGPVVQENLGEKTPAATYQDLLKNPFDESLFDYYTTSQLARVDLDGTTTPIGTPGIFAGVDPSPLARW